MTMKGIDISNYQRGIDLAAIDYDFMICKATEGTSIVHDTCDPFIQKAIGMGKCWGFYHFMNKEDPIAQANYFYENCKNYFGSGVPILDYEMYGRIGTDGAKKFLDRIYELTGVRCIVYMGRSVCTEEDWSAIAPNHALWVAQYANDDTTGYQDSPWLASGTFGAWDSCAIHQYTSHGRIGGYDGNLDLDIAYMDAAAWAKFANPGGGTPAPAPSNDPQGSTADLAAAVMRGEYGNGDDRRNRLGSRYDEVQNLIDRAASASVDDLASDVLNGVFGNGDTRRAILADRYDDVQARVNERANGVDIDALARAVIRGEYGDGDARRAALGSNYDAVQKRVNELLA